MRLTDVTVDPRPVALVRVGLGIATVMNAFEAAGLLGEIAGGNLSRPVVEGVPAPTPLAVLVYLVLATLAGAAIVVGVGTRPAVIVSTVLNVGVLLWDEQTYSSHRLLATLLVLYLVFAESDRRWSISARRTRMPAVVPWWPQLLMMTQLSVCYWFAGLSKVNPVFLAGDVLQSSVWWPLPEWVFGPMAVATIATELFIAMGLWFVRARRAAVLVGLLLHVSIVLMLRDPVPLIAFALVCVPLYALFLRRPLSFPVPEHGEPARSVEDRRAPAEVDS